MKKSMLVLAALTAFAGAASAQSSVTLFGVVDLAARNVKNDTTSVTSLSKDGNASSRIGFRGVEDLGGGLRAGFWLEGGLGADTGDAGGSNGSATAFFNRRSTLSVMGGFGEVRLGRDYVPTYWNHDVFDVFSAKGVGSAVNLIASVADDPFNSGAKTLTRANNSVGYFLPALGGLYGQVMVAASEKSSPNEYVGGRVGYAAGPVNVAFAAGETKKFGAMANDVSVVNFGGSFNAGFLTVYGQASKYVYSNKNLKNFSLGVGVPLGAGTIKASIGQTQYHFGFIGMSDPKATQFAVGYAYDVSKRTALYTTASYLKNDAGVAYTASTSGPARAAGTSFKSTGYELGIRHSF